MSEQISPPRGKTLVRMNCSHVSGLASGVAASRMERVHSVHVVVHQYSPLQGITFVSMAHGVFASTPAHHSPHVDTLSVPAPRPVSAEAYDPEPSSKPHLPRSSPAPHVFVLLASALMLAAASTETISVDAHARMARRSTRAIGRSMLTFFGSVKISACLAPSAGQGGGRGVRGA